MKVIFTVQIHCIPNVHRIVPISVYIFGDFAISQQIVIPSPDISSKQSECDLKGVE